MITARPNQTDVVVNTGVSWLRNIPAPISPHNGVEAIAELSEVLGDYFEAFRGDSDIGTYVYDSHVYVMPIASIYVVVTETVRLSPIKMYVGEHSFINLFNNHFFDCKDNDLCKEVNNSDLRYRYASQAKKIVLPVKINGEEVSSPTIAFYFTNQRSMITTDWAHNDSTIKFVREWLKDDLVDSLNLDKRRRTRVRILKPIKIKLGCDPEFEVRDNVTNTIVRADVLPNIGHITGEIGRDGAGSQVEFRPAPGDSEEVTASLETLFNRFRERYERYSLLVSGHTYPLGGHIHIGIGRRIAPTINLLQLLDDFVGKPTIELSGRARSSYKRLGAYENKQWGFEYRSLPAMVFYNPTLTRIVLKLVHNLVYRYINIQKQIEYKVPVHIDELTKVGGLTLREAQYYLKEVAYLKTLIDTATPIAAKWGNNTTNVDELKFTLRFDDDWNEAIKANLSYHLENLLSQILKPERKVINVGLYGFRADRGLVSNINIEGMTKVVSPIKVNDNSFRIGLPYEFRMDTYAYSTMKSKVITGIKKLILDMVDSSVNNIDVENMAEPEREEISVSTYARPGTERSICIEDPGLQEDDEDEEDSSHIHHIQTRRLRERHIGVRGPIRDGDDDEYEIEEEQSNTQPIEYSSRVRTAGISEGARARVTSSPIRIQTESIYGHRPNDQIINILGNDEEDNGR